MVINVIGFAVSISDGEGAAVGNCVVASFSFGSCGFDFSFYFFGLGRGVWDFLSIGLVGLCWLVDIYAFFCVPCVLCFRTLDEYFLMEMFWREMKVGE